jgi:hypothetical protein
MAPIFAAAFAFVAISSNFLLHLERREARKVS